MNIPINIPINCCKNLPDTTFTSLSDSVFDVGQVKSGSIKDLNFFLPVIAAKICA